MKSRIRLASIFLALALVLPALAQAGGTVPEGTKITVVTDQSVSSKTAKAGQPVSGSVAHDVAARHTRLQRVPPEERWAAKANETPGSSAAARREVP